MILILSCLTIWTILLHVYWVFIIAKLDCISVPPSISSTGWSSCLKASKILVVIWKHPLRSSNFKLGDKASNLSTTESNGRHQLIYLYICFVYYLLIRYNKRIFNFNQCSCPGRFRPTCWVNTDIKEDMKWTRHKSGFRIEFEWNQKWDQMFNVASDYHYQPK